ncbi:hypothetical protein [Mycoplasmopsis primatum]|uniref:hypothetical protein n=1 Tax=Mycoplasmopsis primatum TaxID=55604 RepID=UPI0004964E62|nr:hypothetical protein [Mycoplasmopsis primatum]
MELFDDGPIHNYDNNSSKKIIKSYIIDDVSDDEYNNNGELLNIENERDFYWNEIAPAIYQLEKDQLDIGVFLVKYIQNYVDENIEKIDCNRLKAFWSDDFLLKEVFNKEGHSINVLPLIKDVLLFRLGKDNTNISFKNININDRYLIQVDIGSFWDIWCCIYFFILDKLSIPRYIKTQIENKLIDDLNNLVLNLLEEKKLFELANIYEITKINTFVEIETKQ